MCSIPGINFDVKYTELPALDDVNDFGASDIGLPNRSCRLGCGSGDLFNFYRFYHSKLPRHDITALGNCSLFSQIILNKSSEVKYTIRKTAYIWGFIKNPVLSITSSGEIGFWEHDIEASKMQGRARGRKGERKTYHITIYHHITMEFGGYSLNVAKKTTRARGPILPKSNRNFSQPPYTYLNNVFQILLILLI